MNKEAATLTHPSYHQIMAIEQNAEKYLLDDLYCEEEKWVDIEDEDDEDESGITINDTANNSVSLSPLLLLEQDFFWDDEELQTLLSKERETYPKAMDASLSLPRKEPVEWILKINAYYGFSALTAILAVNYLDRFLYTFSFHKDKPWMMQLAAVTCLSLAAKVEETHVPLLLDLQVEGTKYVFEAKTVQRMELLVLSELKWRMSPVTPISFLDHIIRRLGLKSSAHWEFLRSCENLLLSVVSDSRFTLYLPSVLATATMLHVIHRYEPYNALEYEDQLLGVLKINKEEVDDCCEVIREVLSKSGVQGYENGLKSKNCEVGDDALILSSDDSWGIGSCVCGSASAQEPVLKKRRMGLAMTSLSRVFVDAPH